MSNYQVEIFSKQVAIVKNYTFNSFFNVHYSTVLNDPAIVYDPSSARWYAIAEGLVAVSNSSAPTGLWNHYNFTFCAPHVPSIGVTDDKIVLVASTAQPSGVSHICVANKSELARGSPKIDNATFTETPNGVHAVQALSPATTEYMVSTGMAPTNNATIYAVTGTPPGQVTIQA